MNCIEHTQKGCSFGYGTGRLAGQKTKLHRKVYCEANGLTLDAIKGLVVRHKCDNPRCINPEHLEIGTSADNSADMVKRGRHRTNPQRGEANYNATLTEDDVRFIRANDGVISQRKMAARFGVSQRLIFNVLRGKAWQSV